MGDAPDRCFPAILRHVPRALQKVDCLLRQPAQHAGRSDRPRRQKTDVAAMFGIGKPHRRRGMRGRSLMRGDEQRRPEHDEGGVLGDAAREPARSADAPSSKSSTS